MVRRSKLIISLMLVFSGQCMAADLPVGLGDMMKKIKGVTEQAKQKTANPSESTQPDQQVTTANQAPEQKVNEPTQISPDDYKKYLDQKYAKLTSPCTDENQVRSDSNAIQAANSGAMQQCLDLTVNKKVIRTDNMTCYTYSKNKIAEAEKINVACKSELAAKDEEKRVADLAAEQKAKDDQKHKLKEKYLK